MVPTSKAPYANMNGKSNHFIKIMKKRIRCQFV